jgi:deoxycytidylate deaminase
LTGSFGSGCTYIGKNVLRDKSQYEFLSLSEDVLRPLFTEKTGKDAKQAGRRELQEFGDKTRSEHGPAYLAEQIIERIKADKAEQGSKPGWVVDSIRNPAEIRALRRYSRNFFLFGVYAENEIRWGRVKDKYNSNRHDFDEDDQNDTGDENEDFGQHVGDCFYEADVVMVNDVAIEVLNNADFQALAGEVAKYVELVQKPLSRQQPLRRDESLMAAAYVLSQRSSCRKRKVGAVVADAEGNIISSGYNEVPGYERPCTQEYKDCHRDWLTAKFLEQIASEIADTKVDAGSLRVLFREHFKILDYCRALHAEENAIINLARTAPSVDLEKCTLYTTTYPCRMCANKIVNLGIKEVVYLEPYPDPEAKKILGKADVRDRFFKGVTFKAYSRLYGEEK